MKRLLLFLIKLAVLVALALWLAERPGTAHLVWHGYVIETSAAFLGLCVLITGFVFHFLFRTWHIVRNGPEIWKLRRKLDRLHTGQKHLTEGMIAIAGGDAAEAGRHSVAARKLLGITPATRLLQAQAAQLAGDRAAAREIFLALADQSDSAMLGYRGLIMEALRDRNWDEAERLAGKLLHQHPETPWLNLIQFELAARRHDWERAGNALTSAAQARLIEPLRARQHQAAILVTNAQSEAKQQHDDSALQTAERAMRQAPGWLPAIIELSRQQMKSGHRRAAYRTIERVWAHTPHPQLAIIYRSGHGTDPVEAYKQTERLCRDSKDEPLSHLVLAEAALDADIWGEARRHLLALVGRSSATQAAFRLLARLERRESGNERGAMQWLARAVDAAPDPVWLCRACGGTHDEWQALCRHCGTFNALEWQAPGQSKTNANAPAGFLAVWND